MALLEFVCKHPFFKKLIYSGVTSVFSKTSKFNPFLVKLSNTNIFISFNWLFFNKDK